MERLTLKPKEERRLLRGHDWAFRNEFAEEPDLPGGSLVDVYSSEKRFVGRGFYQPEGGIAVRLLSRHQDDIDAGFLAERVASARQMRERFFPGSACYRWVFGESDGLPGLVADRYGPVVHAQTTCTFYAQRAEALAKAFFAAEGVEGVALDVPGGLQRFGQAAESVSVDLDGITLEADLAQGQKTGLFLDQRVNARLMDQLAPGAAVFDGHCYVGMWSLRAAKAGAKSVLGVDSSAPAIDRARRNAEANGLACAFACEDVEAALARGNKYGVVCIDPPALAKARGQVRNALPRYQALSKAAAQAVAPGGFLITSCCAHHVDAAKFLEAVKRGVRSAQREALLLDVRGAGPDHPVLLAMPETHYLTCAVLQLR